MSDTGKFKKPEEPPELDEHEEGSSSVYGRVKFDDVGNAVWQPYEEISPDDTLRVLLDGAGLAITEEETPGSAPRVKPNPGGIKKGYDPYDSGMLAGRERRKKKDLRKLSKWIEQKKKLEQDR